MDEEWLIREGDRQGAESFWLYVISSKETSKNHNIKHVFAV